MRMPCLLSAAPVAVLLTAVAAGAGGDPPGARTQAEMVDKLADRLTNEWCQAVSDRLTVADRLERVERQIGGTDPTGVKRACRRQLDTASELLRKAEFAESLAADEYPAAVAARDAGDTARAKSDPPGASDRYRAAQAKYVFCLDMVGAAGRSLVEADGQIRKAAALLGMPAN